MPPASNRRKETRRCMIAERDCVLFQRSELRTSRFLCGSNGGPLRTAAEALGASNVKRLTRNWLCSRGYSRAPSIIPEGFTPRREWCAQPSSLPWLHSGGSFRADSQPQRGDTATAQGKRPGNGSGNKVSSPVGATDAHRHQASSDGAGIPPGCISVGFPLAVVSLRSTTGYRLGCLRHP